MKAWQKVLLLIGLWAAFWCFGLWVRSRMAVPLDVVRDTEIYSFDFQGYAKTFADYRAIPYGRFRLVARWGLTECQLYGGHWMYVLPLLLGLGFRHLRRDARKCAVVGVWCLAAGLILCNVHGYFCHDVGLIWNANG